jgi:hypothetical protein
VKIQARLADESIDVRYMNSLARFQVIYPAPAPKIVGTCEQKPYDNIGSVLRAVGKTVGTPMHWGRGGG